MFSVFAAYVNQHHGGANSEEMAKKLDNNQSDSGERGLSVEAEY